MAAETGMNVQPDLAFHSDTDSMINSNAATEETQEEEIKTSQGGLLKRLLVGLILGGFIIYVIVDASSGTNNISNLVDDFLDWVEENPTEGVFAFIGVYFIATVLFIPGTILTLGAGFVFSNAFGLGLGVLLGTIAVFIGASLGALTAFILGRFLLRDWVTTLTKKFVIFEATDIALKENGLKIMSLLRLSPIIPFNALNYIGGVTSVSFRDNAFALFFILPGTILYVFLGSSAGSLADSGNSGDDPTATIVTIIFGLVFGILGIAATSYYAKKELSKVLERKENEMGEEGINDDNNNEENIENKNDDQV